MKRLVLLVALVMAGTASATPHIPRSQLGPDLDFGPAQPLRRAAPRAPTHADALAQLTKLLAFEKSMQWTTACDDAGTTECEFGGILEYENQTVIIESDNTQEAVWDWSFGKRMGTANWDYQPQIDLAFIYLYRLPGWLECHDGGGTCPDYYSFYNCGWGMRAVIEYENTTGDMSHHDYGVLCAAHAQGTMPSVTGPGAKGVAVTGLIDAATQAWLASGLWLWGDHINDATAKSDAAIIGGQAKAWLDGQPSRVHLTNWAASGGAAFYGVVNSYMKEHPSELQAWVTTMTPQLGGWIDESQPDPAHLNWTDWRNAWNAWNMLANFTAYHVSGEQADSPQLATALSIYDMLVVQDTDNDGGIPGSATRPNTEDESWITSYLAYFGIREVLALPEAMPDAGSSGGAGGSGGSSGSGGNPGTGSNDSGCSCNVGGRSAPSALLLLACLTAWAVRRRRW